MNQILDQIMISPCPNASIDKLSQLPLSEISNSEKIKYVNREAMYTLFYLLSSHISLSKSVTWNLGFHSVKIIC